MERQESCKECYWWKMHHSHLNGDCRKKAPYWNGRKPSAKTYPDNNTEFPDWGGTSYIFPRTKPDDWCGDFKYAPEQG